MPVIFINCKLYPFVSWIIAGIKLYETRNRNTLKRLIGQQVFLCETWGKEKIVRCIATIASVIKITDPAQLEQYRKHCKTTGTTYDFIPGKAKYLYLLTGIRQVPAFIPKEGKRHGYVYMDYNGKKEG